MKHTLSRRRFLEYGVAALGLAAGVARSDGNGMAPRILHVMSFDSPFRWSDGQLNGFREGLDMPAADFRVVRMDVKRNSTVAAKQAIAQEVEALMRQWAPDLVYTSDDDALTYIAVPHRGEALPFVFSGVNKSLADHGIEGAPNIVGVLEQEHFTQSVNLARQIDPRCRRIAVVGDLGPQWPPVIARIRERMSELPGCELVWIKQSDTFAAFQQSVLAAQTEADLLVQLGVFALKDERGENVLYTEVQRWVCEHSRLPDISFWIDRVFHGVLASVTVSERAQGRAAGVLARRVLVDGASPASLVSEPTVKGHPAVNLTRAQDIGLAVNSSVLLASEVVQGYQWARAS